MVAQLVAQNSQHELIDAPLSKLQESKSLTQLSSAWISASRLLRLIPSSLRTTEVHRQQLNKECSLAEFDNAHQVYVVAGNNLTSLDLRVQNGVAILRTSQCVHDIDQMEKTEVLQHSTRVGSSIMQMAKFLLNSEATIAKPVDPTPASCTWLQQRCAVCRLSRHMQAHSKEHLPGLRNVIERLPVFEREQSSIQSALQLRRSTSDEIFCDFKQDISSLMLRQIDEFTMSSPSPVTASIFSSTPMLQIDDTNPAFVTPGGLVLGLQSLSTRGGLVIDEQRRVLNVASLRQVFFL